MSSALKVCKIYAYCAIVFLIFFALIQLATIPLGWERTFQFFWGERICVFKSLSMLLLCVAFFHNSDKRTLISLSREFLALSALFISVLAFLANIQHWGQESIWSFERLSIPTAMMIFFSALGVFLQSYPKLLPLSQAFFITSFLIAFSALVGFFLGFYNYHFYTDTPLSTLISSIGWMLLSSAYLLKKPEKGVASLLINPSIGGKVFRVVLLLGVGIPILLCWMVLFIEMKLNLPPTAAVQLLAFLTILAFVIIVWSTSFLIDKFESDRVRGKQILDTFLKILAKFEHTPDLERPITVDVLQSITQALEADVGELWTYSPKEETISCQMLWPDIKEFTEVTFPLAFKVGEGAPGLVFQSKRLFSFHKVMKEPFAARFKLARKFNINHIIAFPILVHNEPIGVILLNKFGDAPFSKEIENLAPSVGVLIGHTIDLKHQQKELKEKTQQLEEANKELEQFNYVVSHDLQEPLRKIITFSGLIKNKSLDLPPEMQDYIERITSATTRMSQFITSLLELSRLSKKPLVKQLTDLNKVMTNVLSTLDIKIREMEAIIKCSSLPTLWADPVQMYQLFLNLIANALKFHGDKPPAITIQGEVKGQIVHLTVMDQGIGIPAAYKDKVFSPFFYHHHTPGQEGTGIGLTICRKIVDRHGGYIFVDPTTSTGTTICIELPVEQTKSEGP